MPANPVYRIRLPIKYVRTLNELAEAYGTTTPQYWRSFLAAVHNNDADLFNSFLGPIYRRFLDAKEKQAELPLMSRKGVRRARSS